MCVSRLTQIAGFVLTLTVMHSFIVTEPSAHKHAVRRGGWQESAWLVLFTVKALTVWLVGRLHAS